MAFWNAFGIPARGGPQIGQRLGQQMGGPQANKWNQGQPQQGMMGQQGGFGRAFSRMNPQQEMGDPSQRGGLGSWNPAIRGQMGGGMNQGGGTDLGMAPQRNYDPSQGSWGNRPQVPGQMTTMDRVWTPNNPGGGGMGPSPQMLQQFIQQMNNPNNARMLGMR